MNKAWRKKSGIGLLELMLALAVIALLIVTALRFYQYANLQRRMNASINTVQAMRAASARWYSVQGNLNNLDINTLITRHYLPASEAVNVWGGANRVQPDANDNIQVILPNLPTVACNQLRQHFAAQETKPNNSCIIMSIDRHRTIYTGTFDGRSS